MNKTLFFANCLAGLLFLFISVPSFASAPDCSETKIQEVMEKASDSKPDVKLNCNLKIKSSSLIISKKIVIQGASASGLVLDCNHATLAPSLSKGPKDSITIKSIKNNDGSWSRPENVTIKNCTIHGSVRIWGMAATHSEDILESSRSLGHTERMQLAAPKNITLERVKIIAKGRIPLYLSMGVTYSKFINSELTGEGSSTAIYLDAESAFNTIKNSSIHVDTSRREQLAIDGSAFNRIISNRFSAINNGGIYVYRNCGEREVIRHQKPQHNQFINNVFYYNHYDGSNPAIWLGSRNTFWRGAGTFFHLGYCHDDDGYDFGSSASNEDYAKYNVVAENQVYKRSVTDVFQENYSPNYYYDNQTVSSSISRKAGCFLDLTTSKHFLHDGDYYASSGGSFFDLGYIYSCHDNQISITRSSNFRSLDFECQVTGNNQGCARAFVCPNGKKLVALKAACNLEYGAVNSEDLEQISNNTLKVIRSSDHVSIGKCSLSSAGIKKEISSGSQSLSSLLGTSGLFAAACREEDHNGGDCHIKGQALCL